MRSKLPPMRLSREEENFLRQWMYDETHYQEGTGPAKRLQREHGAAPGELALLIAAALPDLEEQWAAGVGPPPAEPPGWPWPEGALRARVAEADKVLGARRGDSTSPRPTR
jgi:hypothetical protein